MASHSERKKFISDLMPDDLLDDAIDWIKSNMNPDEVFDKDQLEEWVKDNGFVESDE